MDEKRFDHLAKTVAGTSRRSMLKTGLGVLVGGASGLLGFESTSAAGKRKLGQICRKGGDCASNRCSPPDSRGRSYCLCNEASDCPAPRDKCQEATCNPDGTCGTGERTCDDNNRCTIDSCDPRVGCVHDPVTCNDYNPCTIDTCDPDNGCVFTFVSCDDGNACTRDTCDVQTGTCVNTLITCEHVCDPDVGCVECLVASDCANFGGYCKTATCDDGVCNTVLFDPGTRCTVSSNGGVCDNNHICCAAPQTDGMCRCPEGFSMDNFGSCCPSQVLVFGVCT